MRRLALSFALLPLLLAATSASATSYVMASDGDLAARSDAIALVRVVALEPSPVAGLPATDALVEIERLIQGNVPGSSIVVRIPGGTRDRATWKIWGAPKFSPGERALLFLVAKDDGTYHVRHLMLGAFHAVATGGRVLAVRDLSGARSVPLPGRAESVAQWLRPRDLERFATWLADRAAGNARAADYFLSPSEVPSRFTFLTDEGLKVRWFEFDQGQSVPWRSQSSGQPGLAGGGVGEFQRGLATWSGDAATNVAYSYVGQVAGGTIERQDGTNTLVFETAIPEVDPFDCDRGGGVLAVGGPWTDQDARGTYRGETYLRALEADIFTNINLSCFFAASGSPSQAAEELFTHELGHTLGLGHSCGDRGSGSCNTQDKSDATMRAFIHDDGRGARLGNDDRAGLAVLYTPGGGGGGGGTGTPQAPAALSATLSGLAAHLAWQDRSNNELGFRVYRGVDGGALALLASLPAGALLYADSGLNAGRRYDYELAAFNNRGESGRSNRVGVTVPASLPITVTLVPTPAGLTGVSAHFAATVTGPVVRTEWNLGGVARAFSAAPCSPGRFCAVHLYDIPGTYTVQVKAIGDLGQAAEATGQVVIGGAAVELPGEDSFLQSVIFGPRGATGVFKSDLWLHNDEALDTRVGLLFLPRGAGNPHPDRREITLAAGSSLFLENVLGNLFGASGTQGSLGLEYRRPNGIPSAAGHAFAFARSFLEVAGGSFGQLVPEEGEATWTAEPKVVAGVLEGSGFASTLAAANLDPTGGRVDVELFDALGAPVGAPASFPLGARTTRSQPIANLFPAAKDRPGPFTARFSSTGVRFAASATLLETGSQDQIFLPAGPPPPAESSLDPLVSEGELLIPRVVRGQGQFGTQLTTQLVLSNSTDLPRDLTLSLWLRGQDNSAPPTVVRALPARAALLIDDVAKDLFGLTEATGALRILWRGPVGHGPRILALGFATTAGPPAQRFGMLVDARRPILEGSRRAVDFGAEQLPISRSSYGVINLNNAPTTVRLTLADQAGTTLGQTTFSLKARQHFERTLVGVFAGLANGSNWHVTTEVVSGGDVLTYLANINATGDVFYVPGRPLE